MDFFLIFGGNFLEIICEDFFGGNSKLFRHLAIKNRPVSINVLDIRIENNHFTCECDKMSWFLGAMTKNFDTGKSLSEALIFASTNPQYDDRLFIELQVQYT